MRHFIGQVIVVFRHSSKPENNKNTHPHTVLGLLFEAILLEVKTRSLRVECFCRDPGSRNLRMVS